ncbi:MAG: NADH-quinone oxidoreductase subunit NuoG [Spirochaetia bacterium]|jgi:NADH-quinone oxidoreductase subunit G
MKTNTPATAGAGAFHPATAGAGAFHPATAGAGAFTLTIDGRQYTVDAEGKNLLSVCLSLGLNLPYFCWHPALHSVGACRQCAVKLFKDESDARGRIVMSCMTPVTDGMRISIEDPEARAFRGQITEWLMVNHPHDCPICDEGGECHLQDMVVMTGHAYRRYRFTKRTHRNQDLGPFLNHEMNRCIQCYRCIRFYRDYAGGKDLEALGAHDNVYFGRQADGALENEFSGNLVEVCPTGVFTDKTLKAHYTRKWDLQTAPSLCVHCGVGCNTIPGERYGTLRRVRTRYNGEVNGYFLCDRGRYGYEFVNGERRIRQPLVRSAAGQAPASPEQALSRASAAIGTGIVIGIGSPRASQEANFTLRSLVGAENFYLGVSDRHLELLRLMVRVMRESPAPSASVHQAAGADAVFVLGEDVWNTAPILALNLRQASSNAPAAAEIRQKKLNWWDDAAVREAIRHQKGPFFIASIEETGLDEVARECHRLSPADIARLGFAVAHEIDHQAPAVSGLEGELSQAARRIAEALRGAERPLVVSGSGLGSSECIQAAANIARGLKKSGRDARISLVFPHANSFGAALLARGGVDTAAKALSERRDATLIVAEADLFREMDRSAARSLFAAAAHVICIDYTASATTEAAEIVLPAATFAESSGTLISSEGRAQRYFSVMPAIGALRDTWRWLDEIAVAAGRKARAWRGLDEVIHAICEEMPELRGIRDAAPGADYRMGGARIPRKSLRESGRTAVTAHLDLHEPRPPADPDSPLAYSMEGASRGAPASLNARFWSPGWNSDQSLNKFQVEVSGQLIGGDPGIRLFEPQAEETGSYFSEVPTATAPREGMILLVPRYHVFGSEELSALAPGIASRSAQRCIALSAAEAESRGLRNGQMARVTLEGGLTMELAVMVKAMPRGVASLAVGLPGQEAIRLPSWARLSGSGR